MNLLSLHFAMKELDWWPCQMFLYRIFYPLIKIAYQKMLQNYLYVLISASSPSTGAWNLMGLGPQKGFRNSKFGFRNSEFRIVNSNGNMFAVLDHEK